MPTSSSREAASLPMASAGSPAGSAFSSLFRSSPGSSVACSSKGSTPPTRPGDCSSSPTRPPSPNRQPSKPSSPHCARSNGSSMPSDLLADPTPSSPIFPATHTALLFANSRLVAFAGERVTFKWKDYRAKGDARYKLMTLDANEFIRRFLIHVLPDGFHRIRHYGLFANANRANNIALARRLLAVPDPTPSSR